jgi:preprotein translocase subunit SecG
MKTIGTIIGRLLLVFAFLFLAASIFVGGIITDSIEDSREQHQTK